MPFTPIIPIITFVFQIVLDYSTLTRRRSLFLDISLRIAAFLFTVGGFLLLSGLGVKFLLAYYLLPSVSLIVSIFLFRESTAQKIFLFFSNWGITTLVSSLCGWLATWLAPEDFRVPARILLYLLSCASILPFYLKFYRGRVREMLFLFDKGNHVYAIFPFLAFVVFTVLFGPLTAASSPTQFAMLVLFVFFVAFTYYLMFSHFRLVFNRMQDEDNQKTAERQLILQKKYYEEVDKGVRKQRELSHDSRHHMIAVANLAKAGDCAAIERYMAQLIELNSRTGSTHYCDNLVANAVLGGYIDMATEMGISVSVEIDLPRELGIDDYELCILLGNTVENAIEACLRIPDEAELHAKRCMCIKSRVENGRLTMRIENSCLEEPARKPEDLSSSKGSSGGIGLQSVRAVVDLYQGSMSCERIKDRFTFSAVLCLKEI